MPADGRIVNAHSRWSPDPSARVTDYDAACDVDELVGVIPVGEGSALVFGDEVPMSTWVASALFVGGLVVVPMTWPHAGMPTEPSVHLCEMLGRRSSWRLSFSYCRRAPRTTEARALAF